MLLHIDGSRHPWFQDERWYDLIVILDDASSEIYYAQLVEEESTVTVMVGLREVIERKGVFCALYSDRGRARRAAIFSAACHVIFFSFTRQTDISCAISTGHFMDQRHGRCSGLDPGAQLAIALPPGVIRAGRGRL